MLPQNHFAVAAVVTVIVAVVAYDEMDWRAILVWVVASGIVAAVIDMDVILIVRHKARNDPELVPWANPMNATKDFKNFLVLLHRKGILRTVALTHVTSAVVATLLAYLLVPSLLTPVAIGAWSHLATDVPYLSSISKAAAGESS